MRCWMYTKNNIVALPYSPLSEDDDDHDVIITCWYKSVIYIILDTNAPSLVFKSVS